MYGNFARARKGLRQTFFSRANSGTWKGFALKF